MSIINYYLPDMMQTKWAWYTNYNSDFQHLSTQQGVFCHARQQPCFSSAFIFLSIFQHEDVSIAMFDYMLDLEANQLKQVFEKYGLTEKDRVGIKELIIGKPLSKNAEGAEVMGNL